jgi:hypothetical protein
MVLYTQFRTLHFNGIFGLGSKNSTFIFLLNSCSPGRTPEEYVRRVETNYLMQQEDKPVSGVSLTVYLVSVFGAFAFLGIGFWVGCLYKGQETAAIVSPTSKPKPELAYIRPNGFKANDPLFVWNRWYKPNTGLTNGTNRTPLRDYELVTITAHGKTTAAPGIPAVDYVKATVDIRKEMYIFADQLPGGKIPTESITLETKWEISPKGQERLTFIPPTHQLPKSNE